MVTAPTSARLLSSPVNLAVYPNPVLDHAALRFMLDKSSDVNVTMYDITGKAVRNINFGRLSSGVNTVRIDRENMNSGVYFLKLNAGTNQSTLKIIMK